MLALAAAASACGGRFEPLADPGPASVLQVTVPAGVTPAMEAGIRSMGGVAATATVRLATVTAEGVGARSAALRLAVVEPQRFAPLAPVLIGDDPAGRLGTGSVLLSQAQRQHLGVAAGDMIRLRTDRGFIRTVRVAALGLPTPFADAIVASDGGAPAFGSKPTLLLVGVATGDNADRVAISLAARLRQNVALTSGLPSFLVGRGISRLFGSFSYRVHPDGRISASPEWAQANIASRKVPILGWVRCHRLMLPQLARALRAIERAGLATLIDVGDYGGCYVARTILWDPSNPPSMHAWGLAIDINVSTNRYGARPTLDPRIVSIFEQWGFRWGGRWRTPDGMHFELAALLRR